MKIAEENKQLCVQLGDLNKTNEAILKHVDKIDIIIRCKECGIGYVDLSKVLEHFEKNECRKAAANASQYVDGKVKSSPVLQKQRSKPAKQVVSSILPTHSTRRRSAVPKYLQDYVTSSSSQRNSRTEETQTKPVSANSKENAAASDVTVKRPRGRPKKTSLSEKDCGIGTATENGVIVVKEEIDSSVDRDDASKKNESAVATAKPIKQGRGRPPKLKVVENDMPDKEAVQDDVDTSADLERQETPSVMTKEQCEDSLPSNSSENNVPIPTPAQTCSQNEHNYIMSNKDDGVKNEDGENSESNDLAEDQENDVLDTETTDQNNSTVKQDLPCPKCKNKVFSSPEELSVHLRCHYEKGFYCLSCGFSSKSWDHLFEHMLNHRALRRKLSHMEMAKKYIGEFTCPLCKEVFSLRHHLRDHINKTHCVTQGHPRRAASRKTTQNPGTKKKKCKKRPSKADMGENYKCPRCNRRYFPSLNELIFHMRFHVEGEQETYECFDCNYRTIYWNRILDHITMHPNILETIKGTEMSQKLYSTSTCHICDKKFSATTHLKSHVKKVHFKKDRVCDVCGKTLVSTDNKTFRRHVEKCRNISSGSILKCSECPYKTHISYDLQQHSRIHQGMGFQCEHCPRQFATKFQFLQHAKIHKKDRQRYICEYCGANFLFTKSLETHIARMHNESPKVYQCPSCNYESKVENDITRHIKYIHEGKFKCSECQYTTNFENSMTQHMKYHSSDRKYVCKVANCYYRGHTAKQLSDHKSAVHNSKKVYKCGTCSKSYKKITHLKRHMVFHTDEHPYQCYVCNMKFQCHARYYRHIRIHKVKGEVVEEVSHVENIISEDTENISSAEVPSTGDAKQHLLVSSDDAGGMFVVKGNGILEGPLEVTSTIDEAQNPEEYSAVMELSNELYHATNEVDLHTGGASVVLTEEAVIVDRPEADEGSTHVYASQEDLLMTTRAVENLQQSLLADQSKLELADPSLQNYTFIMDGNMEGSIIELPMSQQVQLSESKMLEVVTSPASPNKKTQYHILVVNDSDTNILTG